MSYFLGNIDAAGGLLHDSIVRIKDYYECGTYLRILLIAS